MRKSEELVGKKINNLEILKYIYEGRHKEYFICKCNCGNIKKIYADSVRYNRTKSCGCLVKKGNKEKPRNIKHNMTNTRLCRIWYGMRDRCYNKNNLQYYLWGGKGIKICKEWANKKQGFKNFYEWAMKNGYKDNLSIDRIDGNKDYEPSNCRWATAKEQVINTNKTIKITYKGQTHCISDWSKITKIRKSTIYWRYKNNKKVEEIFKEYKYPGMEIKEV